MSVKEFSAAKTASGVTAGPSGDALKYLPPRAATPSRRIGISLTPRLHGATEDVVPNILDDVFVFAASLVLRQMYMKIDIDYWSRATSSSRIRPFEFRS